MKKTVALVLSGGGARGIAHIGVIEELEKRGFTIVSITGTSMGALVGAVYALGKMELFKKWMFSLDKIKVFNLVDFTFSTQGLIKGDRVLNAMKEFIPDINIEELSIPYAAIAVDLLKKEEVVFTSGSIYEAIRASISIPSVLTPVKKDDALLVDGGVLNNIPVNHARRFPNDVLMAVNVNADIPVYKLPVSKNENNSGHSVYQEKIKSFYQQLHLINPQNKEENLGYFDLINKTIGLMTNHISEMSLQKYAPDILVKISKESCGTYDFYKAEELVEIGRYAAINSLNEYEKVQYGQGKI